MFGVLQSNQSRLGLGYFTAIALAAALSLLSISIFQSVVTTKDELVYERADRLIELKTLEMLGKQKIARNRTATALLTGDERFISELAIDSRFHEKVAELKPRFHRPDLVNKLDEIDRIAREHAAAVTQFFTLQKSPATQAQAQQFFMNRLNPITERLNDGIKQILDSELATYREGVATSEAADTRAIHLLYIAGSFALLLSIGLILLFMNTMKRLDHMIQEQARAQKAAEASESEFRAIFAASGVGIAQINLRTREFAVVNDGYCEILGYKPEEVVGRSPLDFTHPEDLGRDRDAFVRLLNGELKSYSTNKRYIRRDRSMVWVSLHSTVCKWDEEGNPIEAVTTAIDVTKTKESEESLAKAKEAAEEASRAKSWFLANVSHEIRSPMNSVLGYADLLAEKNGVTEAEKLIYARRIKTSGEHLLRLINDILDLSKVEAGQIKLEIMRFNVEDLVEECLQSLSVMAQGKGIKLRFTKKGEVPQQIQSDPARLRQILVNLVGNAIKFTETGYINVELLFASEGASHQLIANVEDTGVGISPEKQNELFRPFTQVDSSITRRFGGTGLGLHLSKRLAHILGGSLELAWSRPESGSCFTLRVPVGLVAETQPTDRRLGNTLRLISNAVAVLKGMRVLLVDDSPDNQILMKIFLENAGADVVLAKDGQEGIDFALAGSHDLVLMDVMMPVVDGLEATRRLRELNYKRPIIAVSAHALREEIDRSLAAGCNDHLSKPVSCAKLISTVYRYSVEATVASV